MKIHNCEELFELKRNGRKYTKEAVEQLVKNGEYQQSDFRMCRYFVPPVPYTKGLPLNLPDGKKARIYCLGTHEWSFCVGDVETRRAQNALKREKSKERKEIMNQIHSKLNGMTAEQLNDFLKKM